MSDSCPRVALFIDTPGAGGAETVVFNIARELQNKRIAVEIWHFGNSWITTTAKKLGLSDYRLAGRYYHHFYHLPFFALYMSKLIRERKVQVVHSHLYGPIVAASLAACLARVRHVGTLHDLYSLSDRLGRVAGLRIAHMLGTRLVTVAKVIEDEVRSRSVLGWRQLSTVHNGITITAVAADSKRAPGSGNTSNTTFICVARLVPLKRLDLLIRAAAKIDDESEFQILIAGVGPERRKLTDLAESLGVSDKVFTLGFRDDIPCILGEGDCFVLPSSTEGLSCSVMEAMHAGLPVIAANVGGNVELIEHGLTGLLFQSGDEAGLVAAMQHIIDSRDWAARAGEEARKKVVAEFSTDQMMKAYLPLYDLNASWTA